MPYDAVQANTQLQDLYKALQSSQLTRQQNARDQQILNQQNQQGTINNNYQDVMDKINLQKTNLDPQYQNLKNQDYTGTLKNLQGINEQMARQGQYYGGANQQVQGQERAAFENRMSAYDVQKQQDLAGINNQISSAERTKADQLNQLNNTIMQLKNQGLSEDNALIQQLEAQKIQSIIDLDKFNAQNEISVAGLTGSYNGQQTLQARQIEAANRQAEQQLALQKAGLLGSLDGQQTLQARQYDMQNNQAQKEFDWTKQYQMADITGMFNNQQTQKAKEAESQQKYNTDLLDLRRIEQNTQNTGTYDTGMKASDGTPIYAKTQATIDAEKAKEAEQYAARNMIYDPISKTYIQDPNKLTEAQKKEKAYRDAQGEVLNPATGQYEKTPEAIANRNTMYQKEIQGLGNQMDFQAEITKIINDGDTSNDWKIPYLKQEREAKIQANLQNDISTIAKYANNYQAEIDKRKASNPNDPLLPYLEVARAEKISKQNSNELTKEDNLRKYAFDIWKTTGIANEMISSVLGVPIGSTTQDYLKTVSQINNDAAKTNYETNKPYYSPNTNNSNAKPSVNDMFGEAYNDLKSKPVSDVVKELTDNKGDYIKIFGEANYRKLWNSVLADAIVAGQATPLTATPKKE